MQYNMSNLNHILVTFMRLPMPMCAALSAVKVNAAEMAQFVKKSDTNMELTIHSISFLSCKATSINRVGRLVDR